MRISLCAAVAAAVLLSGGSAFAGVFDRLEKGPPPRIEVPAVRAEVLENGMRLFLLEDRTLPMVRVRAIVRAGSAHDPKGKSGLAELSAMLVRSGGAGSLSPDEFDLAVDSLGASVSSSAGRELIEFDLLVLSGDLEKGSSLLFDMMFRPRLDPKRLSVARSKIEERLRRESDDPGTLAGRRLRQLVYGKESPWARLPDRRSLRRIKRKHVLAFCENAIRTGDVVIAAAGDFDSQKFVEMIRRLGEGARGGESKFPKIPEIDPSFTPGREYVVRPTTQSFVRMGHLGIRRHNPDKFALLLMNDILGAGNFKSRLMEDIRVDRGMAYSVWSRMTLGTDYGLFVIGVNTKAEQTKEAVDLITGHVRRLATGKDATGPELEFARRSVLARLVFEFDNAFKVANSRANFFIHGYPDDYWRVFRDGVSKVTVADVNRVASRYLHPDGLKVVVVGPASAKDAERVGGSPEDAGEGGR